MASSSAGSSSDATIAPLAVGTKIGEDILFGARYTVRSVLGQHALMISYLCEDLRLDRAVVLKELAPVGMVTRAEDGRTLTPQSNASGALLDNLGRQFVDSARQLVRYTAQIDSPRVPTYHDYRGDHGTYYVVRDYERGVIQCPQRAAAGPVTPKMWSRVRAVAVGTLRALARLHDAGIPVHGAVGPENVLVSADRLVILTDFGLRPSLLETPVRTLPGWTAPEFHARADPGKASPATDLYAWGMLIVGLCVPHPVLYRDRTGRKVSRPLDAPGRRAAHRKEPAEDPYAGVAERLHDLGMPSRWADAIAQCISLDLSDRPRDVNRLLDLLQTPVARAQWAPRTAPGMPAVAGGAPRPEGAAEGVEESEHATAAAAPAGSEAAEGAEEAAHAAEPAPAPPEVADTPESADPFEEEAWQSAGAEEPDFGTLPPEPHGRAASRPSLVADDPFMADPLEEPMEVMSPDGVVERTARGHVEAPRSEPSPRYVPTIALNEPLELADIPDRRRGRS